MPIFSCGNGKYKYGEKGRCIYKTREQARRAGIAIEINKKKQLIKEIIMSDDDVDVKFNKLKEFFNI